MLTARTERDIASGYRKTLSLEWLRRIQARILAAGTTTVSGQYGPLGGPRRRLDHDAFEAWCTLECVRLDLERETR